MLIVINIKITNCKNKISGINLSEDGIRQICFDNNLEVSKLNKFYVDNIC
jgi:hypothetical protein